MLSRIKAWSRCWRVPQQDQETVWRTHRDWPAEDINDFIVSFPKSGRTWLRVLLSAALAKAQGEDLEATIANWLNGDVVTIGERRVMYTHAFSARPGFPVKAMEFFADHLVDARKVFIVRDPRDTVVSYYFQRIKRHAHNLDGMPQEIGAFVRDPRYGADWIIAFFNIWAETLESSVPALLVSYEHLHYQPHDVVGEILQLFTGQNFDREILDFAVEFAAFENMRKMEAGQHFVASDRLRPADINDPQSFKTREGKIGSYIKYLAPDDIGYINERIKTTLDPRMGYQLPGVPPDLKQLL